MSIGIDLERFNHFKDSEWRLLEVISPTEVRMIFATQDAAREFDWMTMSFTFTGITDARLLDGNRINHVDMGDGLNIIKDGRSFAFGIGECYNISSIKNSSCYIVATDIKYEEGLF